MKIMDQRKISISWHLICLCLAFAFAACSDDKEEVIPPTPPAPLFLYPKGLVIIRKNRMLISL